MTKNKFWLWLIQVANKVSLLHAILLSIFLAACSIWYHHGGILHPEMELRLPFYLSNKPLLNKLYDSRVLDLDLFRARELSYFFDFLDSKFFEFTVYIHHPQFLSVIHYLFAIVTGCVLWIFCVYELKLHSIIGMGLLLLFWTSPSVFLGGDIFRTGKIGVTLLTAILYLFTYKVISANQAGKDWYISNQKWLLYFFILLLAALFDEQGLYLNITILVFMIIWLAGFRNKNIYIMLVIGMLSIVGYELYRYFLAPQLTFVLNGYWPNFSYQALPEQKILKTYLPVVLMAGLYLYTQTFGFLVGNLPVSVATLLLVLAMLFPFYFIRTQQVGSNNSRLFFKLAFIGIVVTNCLMIIAMTVLMVFRHPALMRLDISLVYYSLPTNIMLAMTLAILVKLLHNTKALRYYVTLGLFLAITGNIIALPGHKAILRAGDLRQYYQTSPLLLSALAKLGELSNEPEAVVSANPVYQFFRLNEIGIK
jgi:hypothetical protein